MAKVDRSRDPARLAHDLGDWMTGTGVLYRRLADAIAGLVGSGRLDAGAVLPSERALATALAVSRATVVSAYDELRGRGLAESRRGSGTRIAAEVARQKSVRDDRVDSGHGASIFQRITSGPGDVLSMMYAVDAGAPELADALRELIDTDLPVLLRDVGYHPRGLLPLREAVAAHLTDSGLPSEADQLVITTGAHQAIALAAQMYLRPGATVVVESPSWPGCFDLFDAAGARVVGVPLDDQGIDVAALATALTEHQPALVFVMPTFQNPTGRLMTPARRRQLAELVARHDVVLVEDNAYTAATGDDVLPPPVAAFAPAGAEVLTIGSLSKAVWGGLRIGWVRAESPVAARLSRHKALADLGSPVLDQALAVRLLPRLPELLAERSVRAAERLARLSSLLTARLPEWRWEVPDGGSALWIELPDADAQVFAQVALRHGVEVVAGRAMDPTGRYDAYIRLPFSYPAELLDEAVDRLARAWDEFRRHGPHPLV